MPKLCFAAIWLLAIACLPDFTPQQCRQTPNPHFADILPSPRQHVADSLPSPRQHVAALIVHSPLGDAAHAV